MDTRVILNLPCVIHVMTYDLIGCWSDVFSVPLKDVVQSSGWAERYRAGACVCGWSMPSCCSCSAVSGTAGHRMQRNQQGGDWIWWQNTTLRLWEGLEGSLSGKWRRSETDDVWSKNSNFGVNSSSTRMHMCNQQGNVVYMWSNLQCSP